MTLHGSLCLKFKHILLIPIFLGICTNLLHAQGARLVFPEIPYPQYAPVYHNDTLWFTVNRLGYEFIFYQYAPAGKFVNAPVLYGQGATAGIAKQDLYFYTGEKNGEIYRRSTLEKLPNAQSIAEVNGKIHIVRNGKILRQTDNSKWEDVAELRNFNTVTGLFFDGKSIFFSLKIANAPYQVYRSAFDGSKWQNPESMDTAIFKPRAGNLFYTSASDSCYWFSSTQGGKYPQLYQVGGQQDEVNLIESIVVFTDTTYSEMVEFTMEEILNWKMTDMQIVDGAITPIQRDSILKFIANDTIITQERKDYLNQKLGLDTGEFIQFFFCFTDDNYTNALTLTPDEVDLFHFDSTSVTDGVLSANARDVILDKLAEKTDELDETRKEYIKEKLNIKDGSLINFVFAFADESMDAGLSFTPEEAVIFNINDTTVVDGILTKSAIDYIVSYINSDSSLSILENRKTDILDKLTNEGSLVSFVFAFTDETMEQGISFTPEEAEIFNINETTVKDGILTQAAVNNIIMRINADQSLALSLERKTDICNKLECGGSLIRFVFAFTDDSMDKGISFTPDEAEIFKLDSNSIVDGVLLPIAKQIIVKQLNDYKGLKIDLNRKDFIREQLGLVNTNTNLTFEGNTNVVLMQIGAYKQNVTPFYDHLLKSKYISIEDYNYLKQFELIQIAENNLHKYRIKIPITEIPRLMKVIHFDNPFRL